MRSVVRPRSELFLETPASGSQESRAGGRGTEGTHTPPVPGEGSAPPPFSPRMEGRARAGEGREWGAETEGGCGFPPHPPPVEQRVPAAAPCRLQCCAPLPGSERGVGGAAAAGAVGTRTERHKN